MGWTWQHRDKGITTRQFFADLMGSDYEILASGMTGSTFYAATRNVKTGEVDAFVALTARSKDWFNWGYKDMDERMGPNEASAPAKVLDLLSPLPECHHEKTYCKLCDQEIAQDAEGQWVVEQRENLRTECAGPRCYFRVSGTERPLHQPGGHGYCGIESARQWRAACRQRLARIEASKSVAEGQIVKFPRALTFRSGHESDRFRFVGKDTFRGVLDIGLYRIPGWREMDFEILKSA